MMTPMTQGDGLTWITALVAALKTPAATLDTSGSTEGLRPTVVG